MAEIDEVLRVKEEIDDFIDDNFEGEEVNYLLSALSMSVIDIGYDSGMTHDEIAQMFIDILNRHYNAVSGPTENDVIH